MRGAGWYRYALHSSSIICPGLSMSARLANKRIVLGVSGGIAAYKSADLIRRLRDAGAEVQVVMTAIRLRVVGEGGVGR